jgi:hypothetical protein
MSNKVTFDVIANASAKGFNEVDARMAKTAAAANKASKDTHLLSTALITAGAAAVPLAGAATAAVLGLGAAAGVAVVGFLGIRDAMKEGTTVGRQYKATFEPLVGEFTKLKQIAAIGLFDGINHGVKSAQQLFPTLNRDVALFSTQLGHVVGNVAPGLVALFTRVNPLFAGLGDQLVHGSAAFEQWAKSSASVGRFVAYIQNTLPDVEQTIGNLVTTFAHIAIAAEPFGGTTLTAIRLFSQAINAIPLGVLQTLVPLLLGLKVGATLSASLNNASVGIGKFSDKLQKTSGLASDASGLVGKLGRAVGFLGPVGLLAGAGLGVLSAVLGKNKQAAIENTRYVNELTQAIQNNTVAQTTLLLLQQSGALTAARNLGISQRDLIRSSLGQIDSYKRVSDQLVNMEATYKQLDDVHQRFLLGGAQDKDLTKQQAQEYHALQSEIPKVGTEVQRLADAYEKAKKAAADQAQRAGDVALAAQVQSGAIAKVAASFGLTTDAYYNAKLAADQNTASTKAQTAAMVLENNAAGLLDQALQQLGGNNLGVAQAQTAFAVATNQATAALKTNGVVIKGNSDKALANQQALQGAASAALQHYRAVGQQTGSTVKATAALNADKVALEDNLRSQHRLTPAVQAYINTIFKIPARSRTRVDVDKAAADANIAAVKRNIISIPGYRTSKVQVNGNQALAKLKDIRDNLNNLNGKTASTYVNTYLTPINTIVNKRAAGSAGTNLALRAGGGPVTASTPYIVGEAGPEIFVPKASGRIIPNPGPTRPGGGWGNQTTINLTIQAGAIANPAEFRRLLIGELEKAFAAGGTVAGGQRAMR